MTKKKDPKDLLPRGRPSIFTQELADLICERVATHTYGLARLCEMYDDMPDKHTVNQWRFKKPDFSRQYAAAKIAQAELLAEETLDIATDGRNDYMQSLSAEEQGEGWRLNGEHVQRSKLRIDTHKWLAAKLMPKIYGAKIEVGNSELSKKETAREVLEMAGKIRESEKEF